jgi:hypothetical protein
MYSYRVSFIRVHNMVPGQRVCKEESEFPTISNGDLSAKREDLTEKHRSSRTPGWWRRVNNPAQKYDLSRNLLKRKVRAYIGLSRG